MWSDIEEIEGIRCLIVRDTKNHRPHYVPITENIQEVLRRAENKTPFVFPSVLDKGRYVSDERSTIRRLSRLIQYEFRCHDLRRTFATRALS
jgi:integrase